LGTGAVRLFGEPAAQQCEHGGFLGLQIFHRIPKLGLGL